MTAIASIVEGHGEVRALPILLRRLAEARGVYDLDIPEPIRVQKDRFLRRDNEFQRMIALAGEKAGQAGAVLVLIDADDDCPVTLAAEIGRRITGQLWGRRFAVVIANREYESWLIAGASSLASRRGLAGDLAPPESSDTIRDAKGWLSQRMSGSRYHEVIDQPALTASVDIDAAVSGSRSMRKLVKVVNEILDGDASP
jgi:Domain of unknown function (DUF4276)